jgi:hypothetical protein
MSMLCEHLVLKIAEYDDYSGIYFTNKDWYIKWLTGSRRKSAIALQRWYRKNLFNLYNSREVWKSRGLMIRLYLNIYVGEYERFILSLPDAIIRKQNLIHFIKDWETDTLHGLEDAYEVFNNSEKKKSDVIRFLLNNNMTARHYNIHGV